MSVYPTGTKQGPSVKSIQSSRSTRISYCDGSGSEVIGDDWMLGEQRHRSLGRKWTGCTVFMLHEARNDIDNVCGNYGFTYPEYMSSGIPVNALVRECDKLSLIHI